MSGARLDTIALPGQRRGDVRPAAPRSPDVAAASLAAAWRVAQADQVPAGIPGLTVRRSAPSVRKRFSGLLAPAAVWTVSAAVDAVAARHFVSGTASAAAHTWLFLALALLGLALPLAAAHRLARAPRPRRAQALACVAFAYTGALFAFVVLCVVLLNDLATRLTPAPH